MHADPGQINFLNSAVTPVSLSNALTGTVSLMPGTLGGFKFQLFVAPAGTTDPFQFTATNIKGTNLPAAGRFFGGVNQVVFDIEAGETRSILVRGWSSSLGDDYAQALLNWGPYSNGFLGESAIAPNFIFAGFDGTGPLPPSPAFGGSFGIQTGFTLVGVPEPATGTLIGLGGALLGSRRSRRGQNQPQTN